jgi:hypothetical protein
MSDAVEQARRDWLAMKEGHRRGAQEKVVHTRIASFNAAVMRQVREEPARRVIVFHRKVTLQVLDGVVMKTVVDTGRARNGWQVGVGSIPTEDRGEPADFDGKAIRDSVVENGAAALRNLKAYGITYVANNVRYIGHLEYGTSRMAPHGMVVRTVNEVAAKIDK